jgi:hypothetical protein
MVGWRGGKKTDKRVQQRSSHGSKKRMRKRSQGHKTSERNARNAQDDGEREQLRKEEKTALRRTANSHSGNSTEDSTEAKHSDHSSKTKQQNNNVSEKRTGNGAGNPSDPRATSERPGPWEGGSCRKKQTRYPPRTSCTRRTKL